MYLFQERTTLGIALLAWILIGASGVNVVQVATEEDLVAYTHYNIGVELEGKQQHKAATQEYEIALQYKPDLLEAINNLAGICSILKNQTCALKQYGYLLELSLEKQNRDMESVAKNNLGFNYAKNLDGTGTTMHPPVLQKALELYDSALEINPRFVDAHYNKGNALFALGDLSGSLSSFQTVLQISPGHCGALLNLGNLYLTIGNTNKSQQFHRAALENCSLNTMHSGQEAFVARTNLGLSLRQSGDFVGAIEAHRSALELKPDDVASIVQISVGYRHLCDWKNMKNSSSEAAELVMKQFSSSAENSELVVGAYESLFIPQLFSASTRESSLTQHTNEVGMLASITRSAVRSWENHLPQTAVIQDMLRSKPKNSTINIGYLSYDMGNHPMGHLTHGLIARHDRARFHTSVFSYGVNDKSPQRSRLEDSADEFFDVFAIPDAAVANTIRNQTIDVLIDLMGHTTGTRISILGESPAPVVITYLGYPGGFGSRISMDKFGNQRRALSQFSMADRYVLPAENTWNEIIEPVIFMPFTYQANEYNTTQLLCHRGLGEAHYKQCREEIKRKYDIPVRGQAIVFCNFNAHAKLEPQSFALWMKIMHLVPNSVLLLLEPRGTSKDQIIANLRQEAEALSIDSNRLIFLPKVSKQEHLERQQAADLFLDSIVYGAHSTGADALWSGLPLLTMSGQVFSSRVGLSLMTNLGLAPLVALDEEDYVHLAVQLATNSVLLAAVHQKLTESLMRPTGTFDTFARTREVETAAQVALDLVAAGYQHHVSLSPSPPGDSPCFGQAGAAASGIPDLSAEGRGGLNRGERCAVSLWPMVRAQGNLPAVGEFWHQLGLRAYLQGDLARATWLVRTAAAWASHPVFVGNLAQLLLAGNRTQEAVEVLRESQSDPESALAMDPSGNAHCRNLEALLHQVAQGCCGDLALGMLLEYSAVAPSLCPPSTAGQLFTVQSDLLHRAGDLPGAVAASRSAAESDPTRVAHRYRLGTLLQEAGEPGEALREHLQAVREEHRLDLQAWREGAGGRLEPAAAGSKPRMAIYCYEYGQTWWPHWGPRSPVAGGAGGSEEAVIFLSRELAKYFTVHVFADPPEEDLGRDSHGVWWESYRSFDPEEHWQVFVAWRYHISLALGGGATKRYLWLQDMVQVLGPQFEASPQFVQGMTGVFALSRFHVAALPESIRAKSHVTPNALDPAYLIDGPNAPNRFIYASAPNRGLEQVLEMWGDIYKAIPDARLEVYYGFSPSFVKWAQGTMANYDAWFKRMQELLDQPGVKYVGMVNHNVLANALAHAGFYLYPTSFPETGCVALMKAQAMGAIPITSRYSESTLPELCGQWDLGPVGKVGEQIRNHPDWLAQWKDAVIQSSLQEIQERKSIDLKKDWKVGQHRQAMIKWARDNLLWSSVARQWHMIVGT